MFEVKVGQLIQDNDLRQAVDLPEGGFHNRVLEVVAIHDKRITLKVVIGKRPGKLTVMHEGTLMARRNGIEAFTPTLLRR